MGAVNLSARPFTVLVHLLPRFTLTPVATFLDVLRLAADDDDRSRPVRVNWQLVSEHGGSVAASCGPALEPTTIPGLEVDYDCLVVAGGLGDPQTTLGPHGRRLVTQALTLQKTLVTLCKGAHVLAGMGLLKGREVSVHWMHRRELLELDPDIRVTTEVSSVSDGQLITCAGGISAAYVAESLVGRRLGSRTATKAARILLLHPEATGIVAQPPSPVFRKHKNAIVRKALLHIEEYLDQPLSVSRIATHAGISRRQVERLFRAHLGMTVMHAVRLLRVHKAQDLLRSESRRILDVAVDCGFNSHSTFNRAYHTVFGRSPLQDRLDSRTSQDADEWR